MKLLFLISSLLVFVSCKKEVQGNFSNSEALEFLGKKENIHIPAGQHTSILGLKSKKKFYLEFTGLDKKVDFKLDSDLEIPLNGGELSVTSSQNSQELNLDLEVKHKVVKSNIKHDWERCRYYTYHTVCHQSQHGGQTCTQHKVEHWGRRRYEFFYRINNRNFKLTTQDSSARSGQFSGKHSETHKVVTYTWPCR